MKTSNIKIDGYRGTWYVIAETYHNSKKYYMLEHEIYGDETEYLIVDSKFNAICQTYDDMHTALDEYYDF